MSNMTQTKKKKRKSPQRRKETRIRVIFWICLILLLIPFAVFGWIIVSAWLDTGSPILGDRYTGDLDPAITKTDLDSIKDKVSSISGVEKAEVNLATATLRVYADITDSSGEDSARSTADRIYSSVSDVLSPSVYFTQHDGRKMYDMEIHVYNTSENTDKSSFVYVIETKTSSMETPVVQLVSEPINAELAQQLRDSVENRNKPTPEPDDSNEIVVGGGEGEPAPEEPAETEQPG